MDHVKLGCSGLIVPPLCFGGNVFGWTAGENRSFAILDALLDAGLTFIDTANIYSRWVPGHGGGESEAIIGRWMAERGCRDRIVIATKVGGDMGNGQTGLSPSRIREAVEASLKRLGTDYIDLYQSHADDETVPFEETLGAYADLIKAGKVRAIGASNHSAPRLAEALDVSERLGLPRYETLQPLYNLMDRDAFEGPLAQLCLEREIGVIPYYSLASGFLTGKYRSLEDVAGQTRGNRVEKYLTPRGTRVLAKLDDIGSRYAVSPTTVALAWMMAKPVVAAPIVSVSRLEQLGDLLAATSLRLEGSEVLELDEASNPSG